MQSPHYTDGKTGPETQARLPSLYQSVSLTGSSIFTFRAASGGPQFFPGRQNAALKDAHCPTPERRSLGTADSEGARPHKPSSPGFAGCVRDSERPPLCRKHPPPFFLISPGIGQQALLLSLPLPASQASTQALWTTCQPCPIPALPPHTMEGTLESLWEGQEYPLPRQGPCLHLIISAFSPSVGCLHWPRRVLSHPLSLTF